VDRQLLPALLLLVAIRLSFSPVGLALARIQAVAAAILSITKLVVWLRLKIPVSAMVGQEAVVH
jgi:hypothetical protein